MKTGPGNVDTVSAVVPGPDRMLTGSWEHASHGGHGIVATTVTVGQGECARVELDDVVIVRGF
jgi:hypothetical protein